MHRVFKDAGESELKYGWLAPLHANAAEKYPLVICLHGAGGGVKASAVLARQPMRGQHPALVTTVGRRLATMPRCGRGYLRSGNPR